MLSAFYRYIFHNKQISIYSLTDYLMILNLIICAQEQSNDRLIDICHSALRLAYQQAD